MKKQKHSEKSWLSEYNVFIVVIVVPLSDLFMQIILSPSFILKWIS